MFKVSFISFSYFIVAISLLFLMGAYVFAWAPPAAAPPAGNVSAPVNVSSTFQTKLGNLWANSIGSTTGYCIGTSCITSWLWAGANVILKGAQCHTIGQTTCTLTLTCPTGESIKSLGWNIQAGTTGDPSENEKANAAYYALASIKETDSCVGNNSCTQSAIGTNPTSDLWGVMVGLCSAGTPPSSVLAQGLYGQCTNDTPSAPTVCVAYAPASCDANKFCQCPNGYTLLRTGPFSAAAGSVIYSCYKQ